MDEVNTLLKPNLLKILSQTLIADTLPRYEAEGEIVGLQAPHLSKSHSPSLE